MFFQFRLEKIAAICLWFQFYLIGQDNYPRQPHLDVVQYKFALSFHDYTNTIEGDAVIHIRIMEKNQRVMLDLTNQKSNGKGMKILNAKTDPYESVYIHENDQIIFHFNEDIQVGTYISIYIQYSGEPADGLIIDKNKFGDRTFFGDNWPNRARNWLPCIDHPYDKSAVHFAITAPLHYKVIANGTLREESDLLNGYKLTHWEENTPIPTKVMVVGAARFAVERSGWIYGIPVESWVYPQNKAEGFYDYALAVSILPFFIEKVGPYSYTKLANVQSKTRYGGMENAGNIFYYENSVTGNRSIESLIAHEIAHQWFGNSASEADWYHIWLSEGFATYLTELYMEHKYGRGMLVEGMLKTRQTVLNYSRNSSASVIPSSINDLNELLNPNSYQKGAWILHMLRKEMGDLDFWLAIRTYYRDFQNSNAWTKDFIAVCNRISGQDLTWFFDQWLQFPGHPQITIRMNLKDSLTQFTVEQLQEPVFQFELEGEAIGKDGKIHKFRIPVKERITEFTLENMSLVGSVNWDPNVWLLFERVN
ncbi:MAG TPA: M1 family metallopeptidase [Saprospiraceae bacterium]|nr:M1 family metallopeptidase [Saprospiraceae bacterium]